MVYIDKMFDIEKKWTKIWEQNKIYNAEIDKNKKKFFLTVPYPYTSGALHIGHGRTFVTGDFIVRFKKKQGYNVFWPIAYHVSGMPVVAMCDGLKRGDEKVINVIKGYIANYESDPEKIEEILKKIQEPKEFAAYFASKFAQDFRNIGLALDFTREFTTMDPWYNDFVTWQYVKLKEKGVLVKDSYPVLFDPIDNNAVGEDDIKDGDTNKVEKSEFKMFKFELSEDFAKSKGYDKLYVLPATLRPETIFAVTNLWINPNAKYKIIQINGKEGNYIISEEAAEKLKYQMQITELDSITGSELVLQKASIMDKNVYILPADFVDPDVATGVVYSVPAHAPFDYIALLEVQNRNDKVGEIAKNINIIPLVDIKGYSKFSAIDICKELKIVSLNQKSLLEEATKKLYKDEYYNGSLNENAGPFKGLKIKDMKNQVVDWLLKENYLLGIFYETSRKAVTRSGHKVIVAMLKDQWFLDYSNKELKSKAKDWINKMLVIPEKYRHALLNAIDWVEKRPCARKRGLGTKLPFDTDWVIESLSDSTIYMAFYTIANILIPEYKRNLKLNKNYKLPVEFFDYVFYGEGNVEKLALYVNISREKIEKMREQFLYFYPVDIRHTAPAHISNHLIFYIMHHIILFENKFWPRGQTFNEMLIREGQKMSKSKGNVISLMSITQKYGVDIYRLYVASNADLDKLVDWRESEVNSVKSRYLKFAEYLEKANHKKIDFGLLEQRFLAEYYQQYLNAYKAYEEFKFRDVVVEGLYKVLNLLKKYENDGGKQVYELVGIIKSSWLKLMEPIMPFITQEFWEKDSFIANEIINLDEIKSYKNDSLLEESKYIENLLDDIFNVKKLAKEGNNLYIYVADSWKYDVVENLDLPLKELMLKGYDKAKLAKFYVKAKKYYKRKQVISLNEFEVLTKWKKYLEEKTNLNIIINPNDDPMNKKEFAIPLKPSLYLA